MAVKLSDVSCDTAIDPDILILLGITSLNFNYAQRVLHSFLMEYLNSDDTITASLSLNVSENKLIEFCRTLVRSREKDLEIIEACEAFLGNFDIISENRNVIEHALVDADTPGEISLTKALKSRQTISC